MLKSFFRDLRAGMQWLKEEIARPMPGSEPAARRMASGSRQQLEPGRSRRPAQAAPNSHHDEDRHHHQAYDADAFSSDFGGGDGGGGD